MSDITPGGGCNVCGGGDNNLHLPNPDPTVDEVVTVGNIVYHPQRNRPWEWCVQQLRNVTTDIIEGLPMVWDTEECQMGPGVWPCPDVVEWESEFAEEPPVCGDCDAGRWTMYLDTTIGLLSHVCVDGRLLKLGGAGGGDGCCADWMMADGACNPIMVVWSPSFGFRFYNEDLVSIPKPSILQLPEACLGGCSVNVTELEGGGLLLTTCDGEWTIPGSVDEPCCHRTVDANGDLVVVSETAGGGLSYLNLSTGGPGFVAPLSWE